MRQLKPVETVFNVNDLTPIWYDIPGFPGYQISYVNGSYYIRSFKQYKKYPYGTLVRATNLIGWILTNNNNQRCIVGTNAMDLALDYSIQPVPTNCVIRNGRNQRYTINPDAEVKYGVLVKKPTPLRADGQEISFADFSHLK